MTLIGVNVTSPRSYRHAARFRSEGIIDFVELLLDNFWHLNPDDVARDLGGLPVAFHIMSSGYLQNNNEDLISIGGRVKKWIRTLRPLYVSDHLGVSDVKGQMLPELLEIA